MTSANQITFEDFLGLSAAAFEWADSYDSKDWGRLRKCIAPTLRASFPAPRTAPTPAPPPRRRHHGASPTLHATANGNRHALQVDYRSFLGKLWEALPADEFIAMASDKTVLGSPLLRTQHFIGGASKWEKVSDTEVVGHHQLRVPHQRYTDASLSEVAVKGHAHSHNTHYYRKVDGVWKFAGLNPVIRWSEYDFDKVFAEGREIFGEGEGQK